MRIATAIVCMTLMSIRATVAWRILNYDDGGCTQNERTIPGTGASDCIPIDSGVFGANFDTEVCLFEVSILIKLCVIHVWCTRAKQ
jgi:hypothetical protein